MSSSELSLVPGEPERTEQINRYHAEVTACCERSEQNLYGALVAAWHAGRLLLDEKAALTKRVGRGAWENWVKANFKGSLRNAQRYMALARSVTDFEELKGMSLKSAYRRMGMASDEKSGGNSVKVTPLPAYITAIQKLLRYIGTSGDLRLISQEQREQMRKDFRPVCAWLKQLYGVDDSER